jgi:hypothetical protein
MAIAGVLGMVAGIGQQVASFAAAQQDYKAKAAQWKANYTNALAAGRDEQGQLLQRELQEEAAYGQKQHLSLIEEAKAKSEAKVGAAYGGVSGLSVDAMIRDVGSQAAWNRASETENYKNTVQQLQLEKKGSVTTMQSRINSIPIPQKPSPLGLVFGIMGTAAGAMA